MKICLVRNDKMGDMILTLPVVQGLKQANQDCTIDIVCSNKNQRICKNYKTRGEDCEYCKRFRYKGDCNCR